MENINAVDELLVDFVALPNEFAHVLAVLERIGRGEQRQRVEGQALVHRENSSRRLGEVVRVVEHLVQ